MRSQTFIYLCALIVCIRADIPSWYPYSINNGWTKLPIDQMTLALVDMDTAYSSGYTHIQLLRETRQASATAMWYNTRQLLQYGFETNSTFSIGPDTTGRGIANGLAFVYQNYGVSNTTVGNNANQIGIPAQPTVAVIFNTWENWAGACVLSGSAGVDDACPASQRISLNVPLVATWYIFIRYQASNNTLLAYLTNSNGVFIQLPNLSVNLTSAIGSSDGYGYVGITAATGTAVMNLTIDSYNSVSDLGFTPFDFSDYTAAYTGFDTPFVAGESFAVLLRQRRQASAVCIWRNQQVSWKYGFTLNSAYRILPDMFGVGYGNGLAFAFQNYGVSNTTVQRNADGFGLMYKPDGGLAMPTALAVIHTTWAQWVGVCQITNGTVEQNCPTSAQTSTGSAVPGSYTASIKWTPNTVGSSLGVITATFTGPSNRVWTVPPTTLDINVATGSTNGMGWIGFTGATGGAVMDIIMDQFSFVPVAGPTVPATIPPTTPPTAPPTRLPTAGPVTSTTGTRPTTSPPLTPSPATTGTRPTLSPPLTPSPATTGSTGTSAPTSAPAVFKVALNLTLTGVCSTIDSGSMAVAIKTDFNLPSLPIVVVLCPQNNKRAASTFNVMVTANNVPAANALATGNSAQASAAVTADIASPSSAAGSYVVKSGNTFVSATATVAAVPATQAPTLAPKRTNSGSVLACGMTVAIVLGSAALLI